jgi:hypothetical protein
MTKLMPEVPTDSYIAKLAKLWGYTFEEASSTYDLMYDSAPSVECEPILYAVKDWKNCLEIFNGQTLCSGKKTDLHTIPLYTTPQDQSKRIAELEAWKAEALAIESEWDVQEVAKALNIPLGKSVRAEILQRVKKLEADKQRLIETLEMLQTKRIHVTNQHDFMTNILSEMKKG